MIRVVLKGVHKTRKKLADGTVREYYYAWKGGPRLDGKPGSPEFVAAYQEAVKTRYGRPQGTLGALACEYKASSAFRTLRQSTQSEYMRFIRMIENEFASMPLPASEQDYKLARAFFLKWRDGMASHPRKADFAWSVLKLIFQFGMDRGYLSHNPCAGGKRLWTGSRRECVWSEDLIQALFANASAEIRLACELALETGQRQGDLLSLKWSQFDGERLTFRQSKTGAYVSVLLSRHMAMQLRDMEKVSTHILTNSKGKPWTSTGFKSSFRKTLQRAGITGMTFHDFRGTAITRAARITKNLSALSSRFGLSLHSIKAILDRHYLAPDQEEADQIIRALEPKTRTKLQTVSKPHKI